MKNSNVDVMFKRQKKNEFAKITLLCFHRDRKHNAVAIQSAYTIHARLLLTFCLYYFKDAESKDN